MDKLKSEKLMSHCYWKPFSSESHVPILTTCPRKSYSQELLWCVCLHFSWWEMGNQHWKYILSEEYCFWRGIWAWGRYSVSISNRELFMLAFFYISSIRMTLYLFLPLYIYNEVPWLITVIFSFSLNELVLLLCNCWAKHLYILILQRWWGLNLLSKSENNVFFSEYF